MKILAVETATEACSVALYIDGAISERLVLAPKSHTQIILPMLDELMASAELKPQQLDALAFGRGPGSFTGVRIATGIIQGIAFGADLPVVPVSTLAALAQDCFQQHATDFAFSAMDARIDEIFWGVYQRNAAGLAELIGDEIVSPAELINIPNLEAAGVGSAWRAYADRLQARLPQVSITTYSDFLPKASEIVRLAAYAFSMGQAVAVEQAMPVYLRDKVAKTEAERHAAKAFSVKDAQAF